MKFVYVIFFVPYSFCILQQNIKSHNLKCVWFACLLPVAPVHITSPDDNMYKYRWCSFLFPTVPHSLTPSVMNYGMTRVRSGACTSTNGIFGMYIVTISHSTFNHDHLTLLVRAGRSIGLRCACEKCGRPMYRPISFKLYSIRTLYRMLEVFTRLQRAPHLVP